MDYLIAIVKTLSGKEKTALLRRISNQKLKLKLYNFLEEEDESDTVSLSTHLSYEKNPGGLFTLKNRLMDDVVAVKQMLVRNEIVQVKEQVQYLFALLMNGENELLLRELKKLEKNALKYELFARLKEIYYCYFLLHNKDSRKSELYLRQVEAMKKKDEITFEIERLFYSKLVNLQELFYYPNKKVLAEMKAEREKLNHYDSLLQTAVSKFYLACTDMMTELSAFYTEAQRTYGHKSLQTLLKLYEQSHLKLSLPIGALVIKCLYLKYYYLADDAQNFATLQRSLYPGISRLATHPVFSGSYFSFIYITVMEYVKNGKTEQAVAFISKTIKEDKTGNNLNIHNYYLLAVKEYYTGNYAASSSLLIKARNHAKDINPASAWILIEALLLNFLNMMRQREFIYLEHETGLLRRYATKYRIDEQHLKVFNNLGKAIREYEKTQDEENVLGVIRQVQKTTMLMRLVVPTLSPGTVSVSL